MGSIGENMVNYRMVLNEEYPEIDFTCEGDNPDYTYSGIVADALPPKDTLDTLWHTKVKRALPQWVEFEKLRVEKLKETDHYGLSDNTMSENMAAYRQALRDLPTNKEPVYDNSGAFFMEFPVKPTE